MSGIRSGQMRNGIPGVMKKEKLRFLFVELFSSCERRLNVLHFFFLARLKNFLALLK